jgi:uncharacterized damage-inducible protein DinB
MATASTATTTIANTLLQELEQEAATTRRVLERVPDGKMSWRPHEKSMSLGQLAMHIAQVPGGVAEFVARPSPVEVPQFPPPPEAQSTAELVQALDDSLAKARDVLTGMDDAASAATWRLVEGGREIMAVPRAAFLRNVMLNHWYHHRGQLSVYLRLLGVPVPSIYGPSADENPFA